MPRISDSAPGNVVPYNLFIINDGGFPQPFVEVGVWPGGVNPQQHLTTPMFTVTYPISQSDTATTILAGVQALVEAQLTRIDAANAALAAAGASYFGQVLVYNHTVGGVANVPTSIAP